jgi:uncharacterized surface protein with fasciclin (FAS1) repeats
MGDKTSNVARFALAALAAMAFNVGAAAQSGQPAAAAPAAEQTQEPDSLFFTAERMGNLSTFFKAVKQSGLADTLKGGGPFTVFAPTDEAFARLPPETLEELFRPQNKERLREILLSHIFATDATSAELSKLNDALTLKRTPQPVDVTNGLKIGGANVTQADITATNGVLHLIDAVLMPPGGN